MATKINTKSKTNAGKNQKTVIVKKGIPANNNKASPKRNEVVVTKKAEDVYNWRGMIGETNGYGRIYLPAACIGKMATITVRLLE